jgi:hypothetical protein
MSVGSTELIRSEGAGFAGAGAGISVGSTELIRSEGAGFAGAGAEAPARPAPERESERRLDGAATEG